MPQIKQEPPDKDVEVERSVSNRNSPDVKNSDSAHSPMADAAEFDSDDEMTDDDTSDADSPARSGGGLLDTDYVKPSSPSFFANSSHLSLISRSASNPAAFPLVPNSMFANPYPFFGVSPYLPNMAMNHGSGGRNAMHVASAAPTGNHSPHSGANATASDERRNKRNRTFIDPVSEVPRLEKWYKENSHPTQTQILGYTESLNTLPYRSKFPKLEHKNVQFWFKNRRAKEKRLKTSLYEGIQMNNNLTSQEHYQLAVAMSADSYRND